ncbi:MAG TPA: phage minor head protein [Sedimentisphaerales bacterium]|nr:phage minor head protein [Sedimentisphaerales bacterium]
MASRTAQREARRQVAKQARIEAAGLRAAFRISRNIMAEAGRLWMDGIDPSARVGQMAQAYSESVLDAMVTAHLNARLDALVRAAGAGAGVKALAIPGLQGEAVKFVEARIALTDAEISAINAQYGVEAASITGALSTDLEAKVAAAVRESTAQGLTVRDGSKLIGDAFARAGVVPSNAYQLQTIFRTQTATAYAAGRWQANQDPAIQEILWGYEYSTAGDDRVRLEHAALEGIVLPKDDPQWASIAPPNGWSCRCTLMEVYDTDDHEVIQPPVGPIEIEGQTIMPGPDDRWKHHPLNAIGQTPRLNDTPAV